MTFRQIGDVLAGLMADLGIEEARAAAVEGAGPAKSFGFKDFLHTQEKAADPGWNGPAAVPREGGFARGRNLVVIDGGVAITHAAERTRPRPATPLSIAARNGERVHQWTTASAG